MFRYAASALALLIAAAPATAQTDFSKVEIEVIETAGGVYMLQGAGGNIGLSAGEDGAFVIDDQFAPLTEKIMAAIKTVTDAPVDYVLNTHYHGDHTGGNENFGEAGATIVAHDNVRKRLKEGVKRENRTVPPSPEGALPVITFSDTVTFHWNGHEVFVFHVDNAHTDGDGIVYFRDINVIHMGDVFFNGFYPFIDLAGGGGLNGYIAAQEYVLSMIDDDTKIIPGHGPLAGKADLERTLATLKSVRAKVQEAIDAGLNEEETVKADPLKDLNETWGQGFINGEAMTRTAYRSLAGE
ncbi:MAG: MBL fold metallo-hydrolase [Parvularculaceae bacterium]